MSLVRFVDKTSSRVGRHSWRCKQRVNRAEQDRPDITSREVPVMQSPNVPVPSRIVVKCCCGNICKGARGLKMHQRSCQVIHGLNDELSADLEEQITTDNTADTPENDNSINDIDMTNDESFPELKHGINLPNDGKRLMIILNVRSSLMIQSQCKT